MAGPGGKEVGRVSVRVVPNTEQFRSRLEKSLKRETKGIKVEIPVKLKDLKKVKAELDTLTRTRTAKIRLETVGDQEKVSDQTANLRLRPDVDLSSIQRQLNSRRWKIDVNVDVDTTAAALKLDELARDRKVNMKVDVDKGMLGRLSGAFDGAASSANKFGTSMSKLSPETLLLVAAIILLLPLITGLVATLVSAIPSLVAFGGALAGIGYLGWEGIKKAADAMTPAIDRLKATVSDTFTRTLTPVFQNFGHTLDQLAPQINLVATTMAGAFGKMAEVINSPAGVAAMQNILSNIAALMTSLGPVIEKGTAAFLGLANIGSESFGRLGNVISHFTDQFYSFVDRLSQSGALDKAFAGLEVALNGLSDGFFKLMDAGVNAMAQVGPSVGRFFSAFGDAAAAAMPILGSFLSALLDIGSSILTALTPAFKAMQPAIQKFADIISKLAIEQGPNLAKIFGSVAEVLGDTLLTVLKEMEPVIPVLVDALGQMADIFAETMAESGPVIAESMGKLAKAFADMLPQIIALLPQFMRFVQEAIEHLLPYLPQLIDSFTQLAVFVFPILMDVLRTLMPVFRFLILVIAAVIAIVIKVIGWIVDLVTWFGSLGDKAKDAGSKISEAWQWVKDKTSELWDKIKEKVSEAWESIKSAISDKLDEIKSKISDACQSWLDAIKNTVGDWVQAGKDLVQGLIDGILAKAGEAISAAAGLASKVANAAKGVLGIHSPSRVFRNYGHYIDEGLTKGIEDRSDKPVKATKDLATRLKEAAEKEFKDLPKTIGQSWANSFATDLGFSTSGAIGSLFTQLLDPQVRWEDEQNIYVVKDIDEAERLSNSKKKKKALQYKTPGMRRG